MSTMSAKGNSHAHRVDMYGLRGVGETSSLERSSYRANRSKRLVTRVGEESHPIGNMNGAHWATFVRIAPFTEIFIVYQKQPKR